MGSKSSQTISGGEYTLDAEVVIRREDRIERGTYICSATSLGDGCTAETQVWGVMHSAEAGSAN